jgi:hypothetical protein
MRACLRLRAFKTKQNKNNKNPQTKQKQHKTPKQNKNFFYRSVLVDRQTPQKIRYILLIKI